MGDTENRHLESIKIKGFKSIKELDLKMNSINILLGANGSGKSNFISIFTFLRQLAVGRLQNHTEKNGFANSFFHFGSKKTPNICIDLKVGANSYHAEFEHGANDDTLVFKNEYCKFDASSRKFSVQGSKGESGLLPGAKADSEYVKDYTRQYMKECLVYHFHDTSPTATFKQAADLSASDYLYHDAGNIASFLYRLKTTTSNEFSSCYRSIIDSIQAVAPYFHDFYLEPRGEDGNEKVLLKWLHRDSDEPFSANQLSDGTARFICMSTLFLQPIKLRPKTIILDEPELGLHPAALEMLADIVKSTSKTNQIICSTQSVTFANQFDAKDFIVVDQASGASTFKRPNETDLKDWLENYAMGDIWSKNIIGGRPEW